jgi:adenosylcobinamide-GDP ribazoletransferase
MLLRELQALLTAVQYFTRVPVPGWVGHSSAQLASAARYFPLVGCGVGAVGAAALWATAQWFPIWVAVVISTSVTACLTGAFHEDGLADTLDALGGMASRERALEIMKDSRLGTFGVLGLIFTLLLKITTLAALPLATAMLALIAGHTLSRACAVALMWRMSYARTDDSTRAKPVVEQVNGIDVTIALSFGLGSLTLLGLRGLAGLLAAATTTLLLRRWFNRRLAGYTGDTLGATQQIAEIAFYLALLGRWNSF